MAKVGIPIPRHVQGMSTLGGIGGVFRKFFVGGYRGGSIF